MTNGLGGYASGTIGGALTRVFHGYLIAALPSPLGRTMMLNDIVEQRGSCRTANVIQLDGDRRPRSDYSGGSTYLTEFPPGSRAARLDAIEWAG